MCGGKHVIAQTLQGVGVTSIIPFLADMFPEEVTVEPHISSTTKGVRSYSTGTARPCRISNQVRKIAGVDGQLNVSTVQVTFAGVFNIKVEDRYTLPTRFTQRQPRCIAVKTATDESGPHHETAYF